jgi:transcription elongation GreA/GreB family factor
MADKVYITEKGKQILERKIAEQAIRVKEIQEEKSIAYTASGDGWHDNPGYNQLIQLEERAINELRAMEKRLSDSILWSSKERNTEKVQIGSIVCYKLTNIKTGKVLENTFEIVGSGESDLKNKQISYDSPIGNAIWEMSEGCEVEVILPAGLSKIEIVRLYKDWTEVPK